MIQAQSWQLPAKFADPGHRRRVARFCFVTALLLLPAGYAAGRWRLAIDPQTIRCLPDVRAVLIDRATPATAVGELVVLEARNLAPAWPDGTLLVKRLAARPGDLVEISSKGVRINGEPVAQGLALARQLGHAPDTFARTYRVPEGHFLTLGTHELSLDGRYYGPLPDAQMRGSARVLF